MRSKAWIAGIRRSEACELRARIAEMERSLSTEGFAEERRKLHEIGQEIRAQKSRLALLEKCLAAMRAKS